MASNSAEVKVIRGLINDWYAALERGDAALRLPSGRAASTNTSRT
jgi:hypothetical protein